MKKPTATNRHDKLLQAQLDIGQELSAGIDAEDLLHRILSVSRELFGFENAIIRLLDEDGEQLVTVASFGYSDEAAACRISVGEGVMGQVAASGDPLLVVDIDNEPGYIRGISGARSELAVPLAAQGKVIGVFNVESCQPGAFREADIAPLMTLAGLAAIAIENHRINQDLRQVGERNRELHQLNSRILESSSLGIYTLDTRLRITSWNRAMEQMSGLSRQEALGQKLLKFFPHLREEGFEEALLQVLEQGSPGRLRLAHRNLRGELRFQKRRLAPLKDGERVTGVLVMVEDITEFRRLLDQTIQSEKLAEVGRLSAGIAHEVNNPLAVIAYATQLLQREEGGDEFQRELLARIGSEVERLKTLTGGLLSFSRSGETRLRPVDLCQTLQEVLLLLQYEINRQQIELVSELQPVPLVQADPNKLKQVFINLVMNACQAMGRHGRLVVGCCQLDGQVVASVADNGPGIPDEVRQKIFEPFFTTKKEGEGTGLGLYLSQNIINEHEGRLEVETAIGAGTTFRVILRGQELPQD